MYTLFKKVIQTDLCTKTGQTAHVSSTITFQPKIVIMYKFLKNNSATKNTLALMDLFKDASIELFKNLSKKLGIKGWPQ